MQRIIKQVSIFPFFLLSIFCMQYAQKVQFVEKIYSKNVCYRQHTSEDFGFSRGLKDRLERNPLVCSASSKYALPTRSPSQSKKSREKKAAQSWKAPQYLPEGSQVVYCTDLKKCCKPKKSLNNAGTHYSLCRECIHLVTLPASCTPRQHYHVTCQDEDYYETCLTGEGGCATNLLSKTVTCNSKDVRISLGHSCSCEILRDSIFSDYI
ncbi:uncharacterized protein LOC105845246 [Hydra vulgaris]|uniref:uncharacterized protein LOC105845246 n=1 Tax=Hydra vulgaris TaxID=6087 RepID=UPI001F5E8F3F|nr:uncharacterized protein LOC105845246 [Hydra vulgaris]